MRSRHNSIGPFEVTFAIGIAGRDEEYRLRYRVFVEEYGWLKPDPAYPGLEKDEFDPFSAAFLLRETTTGTSVACQRFVLPDRLPHGQITQIEHLVLAFGIDLGARPRETWAKVSRITIAREFRGSRDVLDTMKRATAALAQALRREALYSVSEPRMARLTSQRGVPMHRISPNFEYHGTRAAFRIDLDELLPSL